MRVPTPCVPVREPWRAHAGQASAHLLSDEVASPRGWQRARRVSHLVAAVLREGGAVREHGAAQRVLQCQGEEVKQLAVVLRERGALREHGAAQRVLQRQGEGVMQLSPQQAWCASRCTDICAVSMAGCFGGTSCGALLARLVAPSSTRPSRCCSPPIGVSERWCWHGSWSHRVLSRCSCWHTSTQVHLRTRCPDRHPGYYKVMSRQSSYGVAMRLMDRHNLAVSYFPGVHLRCTYRSAHLPI